MGGMVTLEQAAQALGIHRNTVVQMVKEGKLAGRAAGANTQVDKAALDKAVAGKPKKS